MKRKFIILAAVLAMGLVGCDGLQSGESECFGTRFFVCLFPGIECRFLTLSIACGLNPHIKRPHHAVVFYFFFYSLGCHPSHFHTFTLSHKIVCLS